MLALIDIVCKKYFGKLSFEVSSKDQWFYMEGLI